jgi:hypothetical protein
MTAAIIGISSALLIILVFTILKNFNKKMLYSHILTGIGFLYVGFVWIDPQSVIVNAIQAIFFLIIAYYGMRGSIYLLAAGYFLHGSWDIVYPFFRNPELIPPHYDLFCSTLDFVLGLYILLFKNQFRDYKVIAYK